MTLRKMLVQFSELVFFVALECQIFAALAKAQPAQLSLRTSSAFPNAGGAVAVHLAASLLKYDHCGGAKKFTHLIWPISMLIATPPASSQQQQQQQQPCSLSRRSWLSYQTSIRL